MSMPTKVKQRGQQELTNEVLCGKCEKPVDEKEKQYEFTHVCQVCHEKAYLHSKCALKLLKNIGINLSHMNHVQNAKTFRQSKIDLWCSKCEDDCYWCSIQHTSKFTNMNISLLYVDTSPNLTNFDYSDTDRRFKCSNCEKRWCYILPINNKRSGKPCAKNHSIGYCEFCKSDFEGMQVHDNTTPSSKEGLPSVVKNTKNAASHEQSPSTESSPSNDTTKTTTAQSSSNSTSFESKNKESDETSQKTTESADNESNTLAISKPKSPNPAFLEAAKKILEDKGIAMSNLQSPSMENLSQNKLTRYRSTRGNASNFLFEIPNNKSNAICSIINKFLSYDPVNESDNLNETYKAFMSMKEAKEYFIRKIYVFKFDQSFMQFKYPPALKKQIPQDYEPNNNINLKYFDLLTLYDKEYVNDEILSFVMGCINYLNLETSSKNTTIPEVLFGSVYDYSNVVIKPDNIQHTCILKHVNYVDDFGASTQNLDESEDNCIGAMINWYCRSSKHYLTRLLDCYDAKKQIISKYVNILHVGVLHWILIVADITGDGDDFIPTVYTMDGLGCPDNDALIARLWFAKFFGLYVKEFYSSDGLSREDFNCYDVIETKNKRSEVWIKDDIDKKNISMLKQEARKPTIQQIDGYNCGVIGLVHCIDMFRQNEKFKDLDDEQHCAALLRLRLNILSMIRAIYEELNEEFYQPVADHIYFEKDCGDVFYDYNITKWMQVHILFDSGKYRYVKNEEEGKFNNANIIFVDRKDLIQQEINETLPSPTKANKSPKKTSALSYGTKKRKRRESKTPSKSPSQSAKKSPTLSKNKKRKEKNLQMKKQSGFLNSVDEFHFSTRHLLLDYSHSRIRRVYDVSDTHLFLCESEKIDGDVAVSPHDIVNDIVDLFCQCYLTDEEYAKEKNDNNLPLTTKITELMSRYDVYFTMDLVPDNEFKDSPNTYKVVAAVIVEDDIEFVNERHTLIHMMGIRDGFENKHHVMFLLFNMLHQSVMVQQNIVFLKTFGNLSYQYKGGEQWYGVKTPENLFLQMGFKDSIKDPYLNVAIGEMIEEHSQVMYGKGSEVHKFTEKHSNFFEVEKYKNARVLLTHSHVKLLIRYVLKDPDDEEDKDHFELWNHSFLWIKCNTQMLDYVHRSDQLKCMSNPGKIHIIKGGGNREQSNQYMIPSEEKIWKFDDDIVSNAQKSKNNCVWLSAVLLLQIKDSDIAKTMMTMLNDDNTSYQWMFLTKIPPSHKNKQEFRNVKILNFALQIKPIGYQLLKVDIQALGVSYLEFIFSPRTSGQYICQLEAIGGCRKHVIAVDTDKQVILDACESHALKLTKDNLDYCSGKYYLGIRKIVYCYELVRSKIDDEED